MDCTTVKTGSSTLNATSIHNHIEPTALRTRVKFAVGLENHGNRTAFCVGANHTLSYAELARRADRFAQSLGPDRRLLVMETANEAEFLIGYLGALRGGHAVILGGAGQQDTIQRLADLYQANAIYRKTGHGWTLKLRNLPAPAMHPDLALLLSTSGSTGSQKLVRLSAEAVDSNARSIAAYLALDSEERTITTLPCSYAFGLSVLNSHLAAGASIVLASSSVIDPEFRQLVDHWHVTSIAGVPYTYELLEQIKFLDEAPASIRTLTQAGGRMPPERVRQIAERAQQSGIRLYVMYGQTEATARMAYLPPELALSHPDCIGGPIPQGMFSLADPETGAPLSSGVGELVYEGPNVMMGYALGVADLASGPDVKRLKTGDLAEEIKPGIFRIAGRKSRFLKIAGRRIDLDQIETNFRGDGVAAYASGYDHLLSVLVPQGLEPAVVERKLADSLAIPLSHVAVTANDDCPRLENGKPDYRRILDLGRERSAGPAKFDEPGVQSLFERVAGRKVRPEESFRDIGGDSLAFVTASIEIEDRIGVLPQGWEALPLKDLERLAQHHQDRREAFSPWRFARLDAEFMIRAVAIMAVLLLHASVASIPGGAIVLMFLSGFSLGRIQIRAIVEGRGWGIFMTFLKRVILPYLLILSAHSIIKNRFSVQDFLLISNFSGRSGDSLEPFWFLEALTQCMLALTLISSIPAIRRGLERKPATLALILFAGAAVLHVIYELSGAGRETLYRTPDAIAYLYFGGFAFALAGTAMRVLIAAAVIALCAMTWGWSDTHAPWLAFATMALLCVPIIKLPLLIRNMAQSLAEASFFIYLCHPFVISALIYRSNVDRTGLLSVGASVAVGLTASALGKSRYLRSAGSRNRASAGAV